MRESYLVEHLGQGTLGSLKFALKERGDICRQRLGKCWSIAARSLSGAQVNLAGLTCLCWS